MKTLSLAIITAIALLLGCSGTSTAKQEAKMNNTTTDNIGQLLDSLDIAPDSALRLDTLMQVGDKALTRPDSMRQVNYPALDEARCAMLARQSGLDVSHGIQLVGIRDIGGKMTLAAYRVPVGGNGEEFKVCLMTHANDGAVIDAIGLGAFHTCESKQPRTFGGNRFYTLDSEVAFDGERHFTLRRTATFSGLYIKDHSTHEMWRVEWDNHYGINEEGRFYFIDQQETLRTPADLIDPVIEQYQSRDRQTN